MKFFKRNDSMVCANKLSQNMLLYKLLSKSTITDFVSGLETPDIQSKTKTKCKSYGYQRYSYSHNLWVSNLAFT